MTAQAPARPDWCLHPSDACEDCPNLDPATRACRHTPYDQPNDEAGRSPSSACYRCPRWAGAPSTCPYLECDAIRESYVVRCRQGAIIGIDPASAKAILIPMTCKRWSCAYCYPRKRAHWERVVQAGDPERFITLTCDPKRFASPRAAALAMISAFRKLAILVRKKTTTFEYVRFFELHKSGWPYLHVVQRGRYIAQKWLSAIWDRLGIGIKVDIRTVTDPARAALYMTKYMTKSSQADTPVFHKIRLVSKSLGWLLRDPAPEQAETPPAYEWHRLSQRLGAVLAALAHVHAYATARNAYTSFFDLDLTHVSWNPAAADVITPSLQAALEAAAARASPSL